MPTISTFYGITITMNFRAKEHNPPHIHAEYGEYKASFLIENGELFDGMFPPVGTRLVKEFIEYYKNQLKEMWDKEEYRKLPRLDD